MLFLQNSKWLHHKKTKTEYQVVVSFYKTINTLYIWIMIIIMSFLSKS